MRMVMLVTAVLALAGGTWAFAAEGCSGCAHATVAAATTQPTTQPAGEKYACPMGCVQSDKPGKCPKCGMEMKKLAKS